MSLRFAIRRVAIAIGAVILLARCGAGPITPPPPPPPQTNAPTLTCPSPMEVTSPEGNPVMVSYTAPVATGVTPLATTCNPATASAFPVGTTTVNCTTIDPQSRSASCSFSVRVIGPPRLTHTKFLAFGDSITWGVDAPPVRLLDPAPSFAYPARLDARLRARYRFQLATLEVINDGIPGEFAATPNPLVGSPGGVTRFRTAIPYYRPHVALIMEGTNDLLFGQAGADDAIAALRRMVQDAKASGIRVCLATIPPQRPNGSKGRGAVAALIPAFNERIRALAASEQVVLVDVHSALVGNLNLYIGDDDLHPTVAGFDRIAETFFTAISAAFEEKPPTTAWDAR